MTITLQPGDPADVHTPLPYPFHVDADGFVGRQDFWKGRVHKVVGFVDEPGSQTFSLLWRDAVANPQAAVGKYVVTADDSGAAGTAGWSTHQAAISTVRVS